MKPEDPIFKFTNPKPKKWTDIISLSPSLVLVFCLFKKKLTYFLEADMKGLGAVGQWDCKRRPCSRRLTHGLFARFACDVNRSCFGQRQVKRGWVHHGWAHTMHRSVYYSSWTHMQSTHSVSLLHPNNYNNTHQFTASLHTRQFTASTQQHTWQPYDNRRISLLLP